MPRRGPQGAPRPVIYQLCRAGERFEVGDGPRDLSDTESLVLGRGEPARSRHNRYYVDDPWMSSQHARLVRRQASPPQFVIEDAESTNGVVVNGAVVSKVALKSGDLIETGRTFWLYVEEPGEFDIPDDPVEFGTWATWSPALAEQLKTLMAHVDTGEHILISGPSGTGKGYLARTVHLMSERSGRFVHLDCRERRPKRLEVDLFGGEGQPARIREADLGTLFLENTEALPLSLQERLCDTLDQGVLTSKGKRTRIDVRVIASTTVDTDLLIQRGVLTPRFRDTIGEIPFFLPGLDRRKADLGLLMDDFLARARGAPAISRDACRYVLTHPWRYHVKALARVIESAAVLATQFDAEGNRAGRIEPIHLPAQVIGDIGLRALATADEALGRPPSSLHRSDAHDVVEVDPERTSDLPENEALDDDTAPPPSLPNERVAVDFLEEVRQVEQFVDNFDALDATDPSVSRKAAVAPATPRPPAPGVREPMRPASGRVPAAPRPGRAAIGPVVGTAPANVAQMPPLATHSAAVMALQSGGELTPTPLRPPSAHHELESIERSYANAVDPDLIVESLRRARGNVSAAARYLGKPRALVLKWMREFQIDPYDYREG